MANGSRMEIENFNVQNYNIGKLKMEDQGCTRIACIKRGLFDMHALKGKTHEC